jgi:hypothetical protein
MLGALQDTTTHCFRYNQFTESSSKEKTYLDSQQVRHARHPDIYELRNKWSVPDAFRM